MKTETLPIYPPNNLEGGILKNKRSKVRISTPKTTSKYFKKRFELFTLKAGTNIFKLGDNTELTLRNDTEVYITPQPPKDDSRDPYG